VNASTGTRGLVRLILRRDRWLLPLWVLPLGLMPVSYATSFADLFPTAASRQAYADLSATNAGFVTLYGPLTGASVGELVAWRAGFIPVVVGLLSLLTVIRHTRTEEEAGRRELLGATVLARHAGLTAALLVTCAADLVLGALVAVGTAAWGLPLAGSVAMGAQFTLAGWVFAAVGAVAAQLTDGAGAARGIAVATLGVSYLLRVVGDLSDPLGFLSWASPIGWVQRLRPYAGERWWLVPAAVGLTAVLAVVAYQLSARRDVGAGLLPARPGPAVAGRGLRSPLALAWRLHRGLLAGWVAGFAVLGVTFGGIAQGVGSMIGDNAAMREALARMGGASAIVDAYLAGIMNLLGLVAAGYAVQAALRLRAEESAGRAEPVLAAAVGRLRWAGSHLVFALLGPAVVLLVAGLAAGGAHGLNTGNPGRELPRLLGAAVVQLPAVWVLAAVAVALTGLLPRLAAASWAGVAVCVLLGLFGTLLQLSQWLLDVSPFTHVPRVPGVEVSGVPLAWLLVVAVVTLVAGLVGLRRRDVPAG
jgi:ABC-2 type transport system permease protein